MKRFYRRIIFSKTPLKTQYKYRDIFQILPIDSKVAPTNPYAEDFPLFLEYYIDFEGDKTTGEIDTRKEVAIQQMKEFEIVNLLSILTNHRFFKYQTDRHSWAITTPNVGYDKLDEETKKLFDNQYSSWGLGCYIYPGLKAELEIVDFTEEKFPKTNLVSPYYNYFTDNPIEKKDGEIQFPETITACLDYYFELSDKTRHKVKSCIYLACDGIDIINQKRSLGFLSVVSAIEGLVGLEVSDKEITFDCNSCQAIKDSPYHCPKCGKPIWGIKTKFVEFLKKFVAGSEKSAQTYKDIYNLRSKITHRSQLFTGDYELSLEEKHLDGEYTDWLMRLKSLQLFRLSLSNWLCYPHKRNK